MYIVSSCLTGIECKYNGGHNYSEKVMDFLKDKKYIAVCPEVLGGLPTPRVPAEIVLRDEATAEEYAAKCKKALYAEVSNRGKRQYVRVINRDGEDVSEEFIDGSSLALNEALIAEESMGEKIEAAILQPRSPSCGSGQVYDGTFSGKLVEGDGITASFFKDQDIKVLMPDDLEKV